MPIHLITAPSGAGPAAAATTQILGFAAHVAAAPLLLLDIRSAPVDVARLTLLVDRAPAVLGAIGAPALAVVRLPAATPESLAPLLVNSVTVCASRMGQDLPEATQLCDAVERMAAPNRISCQVQALAAPSRLGWRAQFRGPDAGLETQARGSRVAGALRCIPLVQPWHNPAIL
jgi:hypothetical protein